MAEFNIEVNVLQRRSNFVIFWFCLVGDFDLLNCELVVACAVLTELRS